MSGKRLAIFARNISCEESGRNRLDKQLSPRPLIFSDDSDELGPDLDGDFEGVNPFDEPEEKEAKK